MTNTPTRVFIAPGDSYHAAISMFERAGFEVVKDYEGVDLVCFLGGTDVDPAIYGEQRGPYTQQPDRQRDTVEVEFYKKFIDTPKVGICRGGQLLNVLNGGSMNQHIGLVSGDVMACVHGENNRKLRVDHHQGIYLDGESGDVLAYHELGYIDSVTYAGYYHPTKSLCFQPHPEWGHKGTEDYFFELIERYFGFERTTT